MNSIHIKIPGLDIQHELLARSDPAEILDSPKIRNMNPGVCLSRTLLGSRLTEQFSR